MSNDDYLLPQHRSTARNVSYLSPGTQGLDGPHQFVMQPTEPSGGTATGPRPEMPFYQLPTAPLPGDTGTTRAPSGSGFAAWWQNRNASRAIETHFEHIDPLGVAADLTNRTYDTKVMAHEPIRITQRMSPPVFRYIRDFGNRFGSSTGIRQSMGKMTARNFTHEIPMVRNGIVARNSPTNTDDNYVSVPLVSAQSSMYARTSYSWDNIK